MSLQLILGNSGSGKSYKLYHDILAASAQSPGTQFLVIVPEQFTMQTQQALVHMHPARALFHVDVLSFQRLAHRIFEEAAAEKRTVLEDVGKMLLLRRTATKHREELQILKGNLDKQGYLAEVKSLISEFAQYDVDSEKMDHMLETAKERPQLYYKLKDLDVLCRGFREELEGKYITAEETLDALCQIADRSQILKNSVIALDGFTGFTPIQYKLIGKLLRLAKECYVTVTIDAAEDFLWIRGEYELFYLSKKTIRHLCQLAEESGCEIREPVILGKEELPRFHSQELALLESRMFRSGKTVKTADDVQEKSRLTEERHPQQLSAVSIHTAANPVQEAHYAAREIRRLLREGYRYREIAVIVGNMQEYEKAIPSVFEAYDIPVFLDGRRSLNANPYIEMLRAVMDLLQKDFSRTAMFRYLRTGFSGAQPQELDLLENYVLAAGIRGYGQWNRAFTRQPAGVTEERLELCESLRRQVMEPLCALREGLKSSKTTAREKTKALYDFGCSCHVQEKLAVYEERFKQTGQPELQKEFAQVYPKVMELFDKIVELLGSEILTLREYGELLEAGFEEMRLGLIPPTSDQIQVGDMQRTRLADVRALFFLGLNDGWVPKGTSRGGLLSEPEREHLKQTGTVLAPDAREESYIQRFYLYLNLTKPSERLYLSYCKESADGTQMRPSYLIGSIRKVLPQVQVQDEDYRQEIRSCAVTPKSGIDYLVRGLQQIREERPDAQWMELYSWYRRQEAYADKVEHLVEAAFLTFDEKGIGRLAARDLYGEVLVNSVSRLEKFAACAFAHFLQYGLRLKERGEYVFEPVDIGSVAHKVIELFSKHVSSEEGGWEELTDARRDQIIDECVASVAETYGEQVLHSSARNEFMIERLQRILRRTAWAMQKQILAGHFYPANFEVSFSQVEGLDAVNIALTGEEKMRLQGRIDRIDLCEKDTEVYVKVIDYKSGSKAFDLVALYYGLQLQLVVYLNAAMDLEQRVHRDKEIIPAGVFYYHVQDPMLEGTDTGDLQEINAQILKKLKLSGLANADPQVFREMDTQIDGSSDVIPIAVNRDGSLSKRSHAATKEQFAVLSDYVHRKMQELGSRMMSGEIAAVPYERNQATPCEYCIYQSICRPDRKLPGTHRHRLKEYSQEEIWKNMEGKTDGDEVDR